VSVFENGLKFSNCLKNKKEKVKPKECNAEINKTKSKICQPKNVICVDRLKNKYMKNKKITNLTKKKYGEIIKRQLSTE
jgi:hypothetical protein